MEGTRSIIGALWVLCSITPLGAQTPTGTSSQTQVNAAQFNTGIITSPQLLIEDLVPGVELFDNNEPGGVLAIRIRGQASVNAGNEPLYVVDGMPLGTGSGAGLSAGRDPLNFLNPDDIASITVLKDAAATAVYGIDGSNGVVLITTKGGEGKARVEYGGSFSSASLTRAPSVLNAAQFAAAVSQYDSAGAGQLGNANTNWFGLVDRTATSQEHNVSLSGSGPSNNYRLSLGYSDQDGVLKSSSTQRISLGVNYHQRLYSDHLDLRASVRGARTYDQFTPNGVLAGTTQMGPTQPVLDPTSATGYYNWPGNSITSADNPVEILNTATDHATTYRSVGNLQARYDFSTLSLRGLTGTVNLGYDVAHADRVIFYPNDIHFETKNGTDGTFYETQPTQTNTLFETYLDYRPLALMGPGSLDIMGGFSSSRSHERDSAISATQLTTNALGDAGIPQSAVPPVPFVGTEVSKLTSFFGRVGYDIDGRFLASATIRRDWSSRFGPGNQWGYSPALSVGWWISPERLKLRGSWGRTGNQAFENAFLVPVPFQSGAVDPNIKRETTATWDLGADFGLLGQRLTGSIDWYTRHTDDLIFTIPVAAGPTLPNYVTTNIGSMKNSGLELGLTARLLDPAPSSGLSWTASFNASHNTNTLTSIDPSLGSAEILTGGIAGGVGSTIQILEPGQPINSFLVCRQAYSGGKPLENQYYNAAGDSIVTGCIRGTNTRAFHDPAPHWIFGFTSKMSYRRLDLSFTLRAWLGNYVYNNLAANLGDYRELTDGSSPYNLNTSVLATGFQTQQLLSDYYVENGSFLRMDNITVGYTLPWQGQRLRLYTVVQNAFTIAGYRGVDPSAGLSGIDNNIYPRSRIFTGGLTVQF